MTAYHSTTPAIAFKGIERLVGYRFGDDGSIWSRRCNSGKFRPTWKRLKPALARNGRHNISLRVGDRYSTFQVHRLILEAFVGPCPAGMEACHNDGNPINNRLDNLRWDTHISNMQDMARHGTRCHWEPGMNPNSKLTVGDWDTIRELRLQGWSCVRIGALLGVAATTVHRADTKRGRVKLPPQRRPMGSKNHKAKLTEADIPVLRKLYREGILCKDIAKMFGVHSTTVYLAVKGKTWRTVAT